MRLSILIVGSVLILTTLGQRAGAAQKAHIKAASAVQSRKSGSATLRRRALDARPIRMFYYFDDTRGYASLQEHSSVISILAPQCYSVDGEGFVRGVIPARARETSQEKHLPIMPLVFNQNFDRAAVTSLLHSATAQKRALDSMSEISRHENTLGFQIDLENIEPADQRLFTQFVRRVAARLHIEDRLLSVAVTPRFATPKAGTKREAGGYKGEWSGAYDYRALGSYADLITLMTYDHSTRSGPPGPIAGYGWVKTALDYAAARIPRTKLLLGIPLYGRDWADTDGIAESRSMTSRDIRELIERPEIRVQWNEKWRSPWFEYQDGETLHTVWYEDTRSLREKIQLMKQYHLRGFAAWRLGDEAPEFWPLAAEGEPSPIRAQERTSRSAPPVRHRTRTPKTRKLSTEARPAAGNPQNGQ